MIMRKNILSRMTRRKGSPPPEAEEASHELPPPTAIEPGVPYSTEDTEDKGYGSHQELELLAADEPPRTDSVNGAEAGESADAPTLESLTAPVTDELPDAPEPSREAAPFEEYARVLESVTEPEPEESPEAEMIQEEVSSSTPVVDEPPHELEDVALSEVESAVEATAPEPDTLQESEPAAADDIVQEVGQPLAPSDAAESPDAPEPSREAAPFEEYARVLESVTEPEPEESPEAEMIQEEVSSSTPVVDEPPHELEDVALSEVESAVEATAPEPDTLQESEPAAADDIVQEVGQPLSPSDAAESPGEPEPSREAAPFEEYGLDLELLTEAESEASPGESEPSIGHEEIASAAAESAVEAPLPEPEVTDEGEPVAADDIAQEAEEPVTASLPEESPDKEELPLENEEAASEVAESAVEATTPEPDIPEERALEVVPVAAEASLVQPEEPSDNGFLPLVRDARGNWRPGKGFSRKELQEAGLSPAEAARLQIRVDKRRRNAHPRNVATLEEAKSGV